MKPPVLSTVALGLAILLLGCHSGPKDPPGDRAVASQPAAPASATPAPAAEPQVEAPPSAPETPAPAGGGGSLQQPLGKIYLQELGARLPKDDLDFVLRSIAYFFPNPVVVLEPRELPQAAYYPPRQRYRAEKLLDALVEQTPEDAQVVVGLATTDISTTKGEYEDWGILGLATVSGRECVISRFRAARGAKSPEHTRQRLAKTVVHEIGHTLGLLHCPEHGCLMEDGKGSVLTTDHELDFCAACRNRVGSRVLTRDGPLPWDPPAPLP